MRCQFRATLIPKITVVNQGFIFRLTPAAARAEIIAEALRLR